MSALGPVDSSEPTNFDTYLTTNETDSEKVALLFQDQAAKQSCCGKKAAFGVSGFYLLDLASLDPAIERIDMLDVSEYVQALWRNVVPVIQRGLDRTTTQIFIEDALFRYSHEIFASSSGVKKAIRLLAKDVSGERSFLSSDCRFQRIQKIFRNHHFSFMQCNLFEKGIVKELMQEYEAEGYHCSLAYFSNVCGYGASLERHAHFVANVGSVPKDAFVVDACRVTDPEKTGEGFLKERTLAQQRISLPGEARHFLFPGRIIFYKAAVANDAATLRLAMQEQVGSGVLLNRDGISSLLIEAAKRGHLEAVQVLLEHRAPPEAKTTDGTTALTAAAEYPKIKELLIQHSAKETGNGQDGQASSI